MPDHPLGLEHYPQYGFAIEVQGIQHECFHAFFHKNQKDFDKQFARDRLKKELCDENQVVLIEVWYFEDPYIVIPRRLKELFNWYCSITYFPWTHCDFLYWDSIVKKNYRIFLWS